MNTLQLPSLRLIFAGWVNRSQQDAIESLPEENRGLREQLGGKRLRFTDGQRPRLAFEAGAIAACKARKRIGRAATSRSQRALRDRQPGDTGHVASRVPEADREEGRWQQDPQARSLEDSG